MQSPKDSSPTIRVLICSANLGNAQPDVASLNEWIPLNGQCELALLRPPRFPVIMDPRRAKNPTDPIQEDDPKSRSPATNDVNSSTTSGKGNSTPPANLDTVETSERINTSERSSRRPNAGEMDAGLAKYADSIPESLPAQPKVKRNSSGFLGRSSRDETARDSNNVSDDASFVDLISNRPGSLDGMLGNLSNSEPKQTDSSRPSVHSIDPSIRFETNFPDHVMSSPPSEPQQETKKAPSLQEGPSFDIIVIGMQEATFETEPSAKNTKNETYSDDGSLSGSDGEMEEFTDEINATTPDLNTGIDFSPSAVQKPSVRDVGDTRAWKTFDFDNIEPTYSAEEASPQKVKKSTAGKVLGATIKAGKVGMKVGKAGLKASKKVTKVTVKTAKTVNTLATAKDHTTRPHYSAQQALEPVMDGGFPGWSDTDILHFRFEDQLPNFDRALSYQLGEMRLVIYYNPIQIDLDVLSVKHKATGIGGLANKGGIAAEVAVNGSTRLSFLTAHLEAHEGEEKYATRCTSFMDILTGTKSSFTPIKFDASLSSHFSFFMGDLNFRTRLPDVEPGSERHVKICHAMAKAKDWKLLNKFDELASALRKKDCLQGFRTPYCNFDPTFKVARQEGYEYNVKRSPSYTDRILFKTGDQLEMALRPILYEPIEKFTTSDHKPIRGAFTIRLNDPLKWKPAVPIKKKTMKKMSSQRNLLEDDDDYEAENQDTVNRENMNVLVSSISCVIDPDNYDKIRKAKKAELPNSIVSFISTPPEAVLIDSTKRSMWSKLGMGSKGKPSAGDGKMKTLLTSSNSKVSGGFPSTSVVSDTMKPNWKNESLHFTVRTHLTTGDPIDLSGAILHIALVDKNKDDKAIGTFSLNLSKLITLTKNPSQIPTKPQIQRTPSSGALSPTRGPRPGRGGPSAGRLRDQSPTGEAMGWKREGKPAPSASTRVGESMQIPQLTGSTRAPSPRRKQNEEKEQAPSSPIKYSSGERAPTSPTKRSSGDRRISPAMLGVQTSPAGRTGRGGGPSRDSMTASTPGPSGGRGAPPRTASGSGLLRKAAPSRDPLNAGGRGAPPRTASGSGLVRNTRPSRDPLKASGNAGGRGAPPRTNSGSGLMAPSRPVLAGVNPVNERKANPRLSGATGRGGPGRDGVPSSQDRRRPGPRNPTETSPNRNGQPTPGQKASKSLSANAASGRSTQAEPRGFVQHLSRGPSRFMRDMMAEDETPDGKSVDDKLRELKIVSLRLDEGLMEGGLEVARIKCCLDLWWVEDEPDLEADEAC